MWEGRGSRRAAENAAALLCVGPAALGRSGIGSGTAEGKGRGRSSLLCLPQVGEGAGDEVSGPYVGGWGRGPRSARLVARSRHYAGRHFLSDRAEE